MTVPVGLEVAVFAPVRGTFDYLLPTLASAPAVGVGSRVRVPFGRAVRIGVVLALHSRVPATGKTLKPIIEVLDATPVVGTELLELARWAADYYQHPLGEILAGVFPSEVRQGRPLRQSMRHTGLALTPLGLQHAQSARRNAPRQTELLDRCRSGPVAAAALETLGFDWRRVVRDLEAKAWLMRVSIEDPLALPPSAAATEDFLALNDAQRAALTSILAQQARYAGILLYGVTGSGKTEVYMHAMRAMLAAGRQILLLVPEIALTRELVMRFQRRFGGIVGVAHSGLTERQRAVAWSACHDGKTRILLGTRSAVWAPLSELGLIIIDEEHDSSYKQQEGFRYSARDVAVMRARRTNIPVVLGSATPSLESYHNVTSGKYACVRLPQRAGGATPPRIIGVDVRGLRLRGGLSERLITAMHECLDRGEQVLLFLNRRGYAPIVICHQCGWIASCDRCDARLVLHKHKDMLECHHCGAIKPVRDAAAAHGCALSAELITLGLGTEQLEETLHGLFPDRRIIRIDRDTMGRKDVLEKAFDDIRERRVDILLGTQMLAKGHDFSGVTLVAVIDADSRLFALDFRAEERFAQLLIQVAGRAGRAAAPGVVLVQTHHPEHPIFGPLLRGDYDAFLERALQERRQAGLPPARVLALLRAEATQQRLPQRFLEAVARLLKTRGPGDLEIAGPVPAPMEKKAGRFRANLMLTASKRNVLAQALRVYLDNIEQLSGQTRVKWVLDVDAQDSI